MKSVITMLGHNICLFSILISLSYIHSSKRNDCYVSGHALVCINTHGKFLHEAATMHIRSLYILKSNASELTQQDFISLKHLRNVIIQDSSLSVPTQLNLFSNLRHLTRLGIINCSLSEDVRLIYSENVNIQHLSLRGNRISTVDKRLLGNLPHLKELDLSLNCVRDVEEGVLEALPEMKVLKLRGNSLGAQFVPSVIALAPNLCAVCDPAIAAEDEVQAHCSRAVARSCEAGLSIDRLWWSSPKLSIDLADNPICRIFEGESDISNSVPTADEIDDTTEALCQFHHIGQCPKHEFRILFLREACQNAHGNRSQISELIEKIKDTKSLRVVTASIQTVAGGIIIFLCLGALIGSVGTVLVKRHDAMKQTQSHEIEFQAVKKHKECGTDANTWDQTDAPSHHENSKLLPADGSRPNDNIHAAALTGDLKSVEEQLGRGVDANARDEHHDTPLHHASRGAHWRVIDALLNQGGDINAQNKHKLTPLSAAIIEGNKSTARLLMEKGPDIELVNTYGRRPLHIAAEKGYQNIVEQLLKAEAKIDAKDGRSITPLFVAAHEGHYNVVKLLLNHNANVLIANLRKELPIHIATSNGHIETVQLLLQANKAHINGSDVKGSCPLHLACSKGHLEVIQHLLLHGADVDAKNNSGNTPLHKAARWGHNKCIQLLLDQKADINAVNAERSTPLHKAVEENHAETVHLLLLRGADPHLTNKEKMTPMDIAKRKEYHECMTFFTEVVHTKSLEIA